MVGQEAAGGGTSACGGKSEGWWVVIQMRVLAKATSRATVAGTALEEAKMVAPA